MHPATEMQGRFFFKNKFLPLFFDLYLDFGFLFESSPGGDFFESSPFEPHMKITSEYLDIMGGHIDSKQFHLYQSLSIRAFLALQPYWQEIVHLVRHVILYCKSTDKKEYVLLLL